MLNICILCSNTLDLARCITFEMIGHDLKDIHLLTNIYQSSDIKKNCLQSSEP